MAELSLEYEEISTMLTLIDVAIVENNKKFSTTENMHVQYWAALKNRGDVLHKLKSKLLTLKPL